MTAALAGAVELLDRSLAYTRTALAEVERVPGATPTPCHGWPLAKLLAHMEDAIDAYTEAASGRVSLAPTTGRSRLDAIRLKACALLGWWLQDADPGPVGIGDRWLAAEVLVGAAALEITLHGWDLHVTAGRAEPVPAGLATPLLALAEHPATPPLPCVGPRLVRSAAVDDSGRLLALLGRPS